MDKTKGEPVAVSTGTPLVHLVNFHRNKTSFELNGTVTGRSVLKNERKNPFHFYNRIFHALLILLILIIAVSLEIMKDSIFTTNISIS